MSKKLFVSDLKELEPGERFRDIFQVHRKEIRKKKNGGQYLSLSLSDRSGRIEARMWDNAAAVADRFEERDFVRVRGETKPYKGHHQAVLHRLGRVGPEDLEPADFLPSTDRDVLQMYSEILAVIDSFRNPHLKALMDGIFGDPDIKQRFQRAPAASGMHHAKVGGLLEHVVSCLGMAQLVASHYEEIDRDLLASGVLLHDFGKIFELSAERAIEYTDEGRLLGHISIGSAWVARRCDSIEGFPRRLRALLLHMILSHHGKMEFGSPREPLFPEALALHYIDDLDSRLDMMRQAIQGISKGAWSKRQRGLGRYVLDRSRFLADGNRGEDPAESGPQDGFGATLGPSGTRPPGRAGQLPVADSQPSSAADQRVDPPRRTSVDPTEPLSVPSPLGLFTAALPPEGPAE